MKTTLILIRHGVTNKNNSGTTHLINDPEPLNEQGLVQIKKTAQELLSKKLTKIYSSNEFRAVQSAQIIGDLHRTPHQKIADFGERNWGILQTSSWEEIEQILNAMEIEQRIKFKPRGGESWEEFEIRLIKALKAVLKRHPKQTIVIVTHGGALRAMMPTILNIPKEQRHDYYFDNASISEFEFDGQNFSPNKINQTSHL